METMFYGKGDLLMKISSVNQIYIKQEIRCFFYEKVNTLKA